LFLTSSEDEADLTGLPPEEMTELEKCLFPESVEDNNSKSTFLNERNFILSRWHLNIKQFLEYSKEFDEDIYKYLNRFGYVNFGVIQKKPQTLKKENVIIIGNS
jgi:hypothetical protein